MKARWQFWLPMAVSIAAVVFTGLQAMFIAFQWFSLHQQVSLSVRPSVDFWTQDDGDPKLGIAITNAGPGPARIKSVLFFVDRKLMKDGDEALLSAKFDPRLDHGIELEQDDSVAVGQTVWIVDYRTKNKKESGRFGDFLDDHLGVKVIYCSLIGECWPKCSTKDFCD